MSNPLNNMFQALADPTRRQILQMLNEGDKSAGEIASAFNISAPSISHHLSVLKNANLVAKRRSGQSIVYSLNTTVMQELAQVVMELLNIGAQDTDKSESESKHADG
jgi:DNA-binding transcriptional ArsR family regulator